MVVKSDGEVVIVKGGQKSFRGEERLKNVGKRRGGLRRKVY